MQLACLPIGYITLAMGNGEEEQAASGTNDASARSKDTVAGRLKGFKILRLIRLGKMLRLLRIGRVLERASVLSQDTSKLLPRFRLAFEPALNSAWLFVSTGGGVCVCTRTASRNSSLACGFAPTRAR